MKKNIIALLLLLSLTACVHTKITAPTNENNQTATDSNQTSKKMTIDIDEGLKLLELPGLRDSTLKIIDEPIYIGDNDEVSFKGDAMQKKSPLLIKIGEREPVTFSGNNYTVKTYELKNGDFITIKDKNGDVFVDVSVVK